MKFAPNQPFATDQPAVDVDPGLPPGAYRFRLEVVNAAGRRSQPAEAVVTILDGAVTPPGGIDPRLITPVVPAGLVVGRSTPTPAPAPPAPAVAPPASPARRPRRRTNPPTP